MAAAEHVFEIRAEPEEIWSALRAEAEEGVRAGRAAVLTEQRPWRLELDVTLGWGLIIHYAYELRRAAGGAQVTVAITPRGLRWALSNILMLGRGITPFSLAAAQGLANLKQTLESPDEPPQQQPR